MTQSPTGPVIARDGTAPNRPSRRPGRSALTVGAIIVFAAAASGATYLAMRPSSATPTPSASSATPATTKAATLFLSGTLSLHDGTGKQGTACTGIGGFKDIGVGTQVAVSDGASKTIALGRLDEGARDVTGDCVFPFSLTIPAGEQIYGIEVSHRGRVQFQAEDLTKPVSLTLGD